MTQKKNLLMRTLKKRLPLGTERRSYHWGFIKDPITEESKRILSLRNLKGTLRGYSGASGPSLTLTSQETVFFLLVMVYDRVGDGDKHLKHLVLEGLVFMIPVT